MNPRSTLAGKPWNGDPDADPNKFNPRNTMPATPETA